MSTPIIKTKMTAAEWKARYAEICKEFPDNPPKLGRLSHEQLSRIRQWEQFEWCLSNPPSGRWRVVKVPSDPAFAFKAIYSHVAGMELGLPLTKT
jgi:hypothetical protein